MHRSRLRFLLAGTFAVLALFVAACGGDDSSSSSTSSSSGSSTSSAKASGTDNTKAADTPGKKGGKITMLAGSDVDFLDPGHTYYTQGYMVVYPTQRTQGPTDMVDARGSGGGRAWVRPGRGVATKRPI